MSPRQGGPESVVHPPCALWCGRPVERDAPAIVAHIREFHADDARAMFQADCIEAFLVWGSPA